MSTVYQLKRKLEAIKIHHAQLNKSPIRIIMWRPGDPVATKDDISGWNLEKEEMVRPTK